MQAKEKAISARTIQIIGASVVQTSVSAVITRADGRVEDLGEIAYWHRNPLKRLQHRIAAFIRHLIGR